MLAPRPLFTLLACFAFVGCIDDPHEEMPPGQGGPDAGAADAMADATDDTSVDLGPPGPDASPPMSCAEAVEHYRLGGVGPVGCEGWAEPCTATLDTCCEVELTCADGLVERVVTCDLDRVEPADAPADPVPPVCTPHCDQHDLDTCALDPRCAPFVLAGCGPAPPQVYVGPVCAPRWGAACQSNDDCSEDEYCAAFWIDPCAGAECEACGAEARYCATRLPAPEAEAP